MVVTNGNPIVTGGETMAKHRLYWISLLVLGVWLAATPIALAGGGQDNFTISMTISQQIVAPGASITVTGSGADPALRVAVLIVPSPNSGANALASVEAVPDAGGNFSAVVTVPDTAATGRYAVRAEQPPVYGGLVRQFFWVGICVNQCTGQSLGSMLPDTGGSLPTGASIPLVLSGILVSALAVRGVGRAVRGS
jgi:hypothetical protein